MRKMVCLNCSKEFEYKFLSRSIRKFCGSSCAASFNNRGVKRYKPKGSELKEVNSAYLAHIGRAEHL
jgi:hypothetical protein